MFSSEAGPLPRDAARAAVGKRCGWLALCAPNVSLDSPQLVAVIG